MDEIYWISGHGKEPMLGLDRDVFIVPEGCYIIVRAKVSEPTITLEFLRYQNLIKTIPRHILQEPKKHISQLIHKLGNVYLYVPGEECPNFRYKFTSCIRQEDLFSVCTKQAGVIPIHKLKEDHLSKLINSNVYHNNVDHAIDYIVSLYKDSIFPTRHAINDILLRIKPHLPVSEHYVHDFALRMYSPKTAYERTSDMDIDTIDEAIEHILSLYQDDFPNVSEITDIIEKMKMYVPNYTRLLVIELNKYEGYETSVSDQFYSHSNMNDAIDNIIDVYVNKGYDVDDIRSLLEHVKNIRINYVDEFLSELPNYAPMYIDEISNTQKQLCNDFPGIYYNFVCRTIPEVSKHTTYVNHNHKIVHTMNEGRTDRNAYKREYLNFIRKHRISNVLTQRKYYQEYSNNRYHINKQIEILLNTIQENQNSIDVLMDIPVDTEEEEEINQKTVEYLEYTNKQLKIELLLLLKQKQKQTQTQKQSPIKIKSRMPNNDYSKNSLYSH